ncbi:hypothetical protein F4780DRAFT_786881 [Xylariomycetidae sp. FL0641]|nr:hypothetical protein F4780DRAFT_786881 [Xylariomycetidae sp. FL0641]
MSLRRLAAAAFLAVGPLLAAADGTKASLLEEPTEAPVLGTDTVHGCYKSLGTLKHNSENQFNTQGLCAGICRDKEGKAVAATYATSCFCGDEYPNSDDLDDDSKCDEPCPGYGDVACGGLDHWTVYNTGKRVSVGEAPAKSKSTSSSASASTTTDAAGKTVTASAVPEKEDNSGGGTNTVGVAVGVVVAVLVIAAIGGGAFFWMRRKKHGEMEEESRRNAAVNAFIAGGGKPPSSSGGLSMSDARMDPIMNRRLSDGSIADNQDYSRRILRVTNA